MSKLNFNNYKNMGQKIDLDWIRESEKNYVSSWGFYFEQIEKQGKLVEELTNSNDFNYIELEKANESLSKIAARLDLEKKNIDNFQKIKQEYLLNSLLSGILSPSKNIS